MKTPLEKRRRNEIWRQNNKDKVSEGCRRRRREQKQRLIERLGGKCVGCGTSENLQFDHINAATKKYNITKHLGVRDEKLYEEVDKCQLLCHDCHKVKTRAHCDHNELLKGYKLASIDNTGDRIIITYELH